MDVVWLNWFKLNRFETGLSASVNGAIMNVVWLNRFKVNRFETGLSASVNGALQYVNTVLTRTYTPFDYKLPLTFW